MFLNEPIIKVLELEYKDTYLKSWHNAYLNSIGAFEYHVTEGFWLVLETENYYATIGYDGVQKYAKPYEFSKEKFCWWSDGSEDWIDCERMFFEGQKIHNVEQNSRYQTIYFDNFKLNLYVYGEDDNFPDSGTFGDGVAAMAVGGHLLKKCTCGGKGELLVDERSDYAVRCNQCHRSTYFDMILKERIDAWNNDDTPCTIHTGLETLKSLLETQTIKYIALSSDDYNFQSIDETACYCATAIIVFENTMFLLSSQQAGENKFYLTGHELSNYNREFWSNVITPSDKIEFVDKKENFEKRKTLRFKLDDADLLIETAGSELYVVLDEAQQILNQNIIKRKTLF